MTQPATVSNGDPSRISIDDIRMLIAEIKDAGTAGPDLANGAGESWDHHHENHLSAEDITGRIAYEQKLVDGQLSGGESRYVITASGTRRVHLPECYHVRHVIHRDEAWKYVAATPEPVSFSDLGFVYAMPQILSRDEVEALSSYVACQVCAPTLNHQRKLWVLNTRPMKATSIGLHHIGREVHAEDGAPLGMLVSHQRIVTVAGIRSITTTTETVIEGDGTEKYHVAPRNSTDDDFVSSLQR